MKGDLVATSDLRVSGIASINGNGVVNPTKTINSDNSEELLGLPDELVSRVRDLGMEVNDDTALVDIFKAREQGMNFRQLSALFTTALEIYEERGHNLYRRQLLGPSDAVAGVDYPREEGTREMIILASNNYLGLTTHPKVIQAACDAAQTYGTGAGSSPLLVGTFPVTAELERKLAKLKGVDEACVFSSGYGANIGVISSVCGKNDLVVVDRLAHASIIDGAKLSGANVRLFRHNDAKHLDRVLSRRKNQSGTTLVAVEGIYSMDGDMAPLEQLIEVTKKHGALLLVDEAHSTGVIGPNGGGAVAHFGLTGEVDLIVGTLSKALAASGGFVCGSESAVTYIRYFARSAMFSTCIPPMTAATASAALDLVHNEPQLRERLWENCRFMYGELKRMGFNVGVGPSPIIPVIVGTMGALRTMTLALHCDNICVNSVPFPAVAHGSERLRISLTANHTLDQLERALKCIEIAGKDAGVI